MAERTEKRRKNTKNVTIETILRVFRALKTNIKFTLERSNEKLEIA